MNGSRLSLLKILLLLMLASLLRVAFPTADPPKNLSNSRGIFVDGPKNVHNARNLVLYGNLRMDEGWSPICYSPSFTYVTALVFKMFGCGLLQARIYPIFCSILSVLLVYAIAKKHWGEREGLLASCFLGLDFTTLSYGRLAMFETPMTTTMLLSLYTWQRGKHGTWPWYCLSGIFLGLSFLAKSMAVYFIGTFLVFVFLDSLQDAHFRPRRQVLRPWPILGSFLMVMTLWWVFFFLPNRSWVSKIGGGWLDLAMSGGLLDLLKNMFRFSAFWHLGRCLPILVLGLYWIFRSCSRILVERRLSFDPLTLVCSFWFMGGALFLSSLTYRPLRYFVALTPPIFLLASKAIVELWDAKHEEKRSSFTPWIHPIFFVLMSWLIWISWLDPLLLSRFKHTFSLIHAWYVRGGLFLFLSLMVVGIFFASSIAWKHCLKTTSWHIPSTPRMVSCFLGFLFLCTQATLYLQWVQRREYGVRDGSRALRRLPFSVIAGRGANAACIENQHQPICVTGWWDRGLRDEEGKDLFERYPITHLQMTTHLGGVVPWYFRNYPDRMSYCRFEESAHFHGVDYPIYALGEHALLGPTKGQRIRLEAEEQFYHVGQRTPQPHGSIQSEKKRGFLLLTVPFVPQADQYLFEVVLSGDREAARLEIRENLHGEPVASMNITLDGPWRKEAIQVETSGQSRLFLSLYVAGQGRAAVDYVEISAPHSEPFPHQP